MSHEIIRAVALYASIVSVTSAIFFIAFLEVYSLVTHEAISIYLDTGWRVWIPKVSGYMMLFSSIVSSCATIFFILGS